MKRRAAKPDPEPPPIDHDEVRRLIAELDQTRASGVSIHAHAAAYALYGLHYNAGSLVTWEIRDQTPWEPRRAARTPAEIDALVDLFFERMAPGFSVETSPYYASRERAD